MHVVSEIRESEHKQFVHGCESSGLIVLLFTITLDGTCMRAHSGKPFTDVWCSRSYYMYSTAQIPATKIKVTLHPNIPLDPKDLIVQPHPSGKEGLDPSASTLFRLFFSFTYNARMAPNLQAHTCFLPTGYIPHRRPARSSSSRKSIVRSPGCSRSDPRVRSHTACNGEEASVRPP